jgi:methyl-accepting chemotaxis protein
MQDDYQMTLRDWMSQIKVRLIGLMLAMVSLPIISGLVWDYWTAQRSAAGIERELVSVLVGGLCLIVGVWEVQRISQKAMAVGLAADAFANRGELDRKVPDQGRDELAWTAYSFNRMMKRVEKIASVAGQAASGDLTAEIEAKSEDDRLAHSLNVMIADLRHLIRQVVESAHAVSTASEQLASSADHAGGAAQQIVVTIQQVAQGTAQQTESVTLAAASEGQLSRAIDSVARGAQRQASAVARSYETTTQIATVIGQVTANVRQLEEVKRKVGLSAQRVQEMENRSKQIGVVVNTIDDIASQTNILALNAAIEANQAGEHGKGFAVVANEVRNLARQSGTATKEIAKLIREMQKAVGETTAAIEESTVEVQQQVEEISTATQQMDTLSNELVGAMEAVSAVVEENTAATEEMAASSDKVSQAIESVANISEENSASAQEVSVAVEEMSAQVEEVTASAQSLAEMAQTLQQAAARFKLSAAETKGAQ